MDPTAARADCRGMVDPSLPDLSGTVAVVTGASGGIGAGVARRFAAAGAALVLGYRSGAGRARALAAEIVGNGGRAVAAAADVTDPDGCAALMAVAGERFGRLDAVVGCAGVQPVTPLPELTAADWHAVTERRSGRCLPHRAGGGRRAGRAGRGRSR